MCMCKAKTSGNKMRKFRRPRCLVRRICMLFRHAVRSNNDCKSLYCGDNRRIFPFVSGISFTTGTFGKRRDAMCPITYRAAIEYARVSPKPSHFISWRSGSEIKAPGHMLWSVHGSRPTRCSSPCKFHYLRHIRAVILILGLPYMSTFAQIISSNYRRVSA